jgi:hypothetical protein
MWRNAVHSDLPPVPDRGEPSPPDGRPGVRSHLTAVASSAPTRDEADTSCSIRITLHPRPEPERYATAVLACQQLMAMLGMSGSATVWPDGTVTDAYLNSLRDRWDRHDPWAP